MERLNDKGNSRQHIVPQKMDQLYSGGERPIRYIQGQTDKSISDSFLTYTGTKKLPYQEQLIEKKVVMRTKSE